MGTVSASGATITYTTVPSAVDAGTPSPTVTCLPVSGTNFALNSTNTVTCSSTDAAGNTGTQSYTITITDTANPVLNIPTSVTVESVAPATSAATFTVSATDNVDTFTSPVTSSATNPALVCDYLSGDVFIFGTTIVNCSATDSQ